MRIKVLNLNFVFIIHHLLKSVLDDLCIMNIGKKRKERGECMIRKNRREFICGKLLLLSHSAYDDENL
jgi:hypothetical protein